jgi:hypothetical protein
MSREHVIYRPSTRAATTTGSSTLPMPWDAAAVGGAHAQGGLLLTGIVAGRRRWMLTDSTGARFRFLVRRPGPALSPALKPDGVVLNCDRRSWACIVGVGAGAVSVPARLRR